jgi:hypothetical protein
MGLVKAGENAPNSKISRQDVMVTPLAVKMGYEAWRSVDAIMPGSADGTDSKIRFFPLLVNLPPP